MEGIFLQGTGVRGEGRIDFYVFKAFFEDQTGETKHNRALSIKHMAHASDETMRGVTNGQQ